MYFQHDHAPLPRFVSCNRCQHPIVHRNIRTCYDAPSVSVFKYNSLSRMLEFSDSEDEAFFGDDTDSGIESM